MEWQYIPANPAARVKAPRAKRDEGKYLDDIQSIRLLELLEDQPIYYKTAITVLLFTGMRRSELLGLEWKDIDFAKQTISIHCSLQYISKHGIVKDEPKTKSSYRVIKVPPTALKSLREYLAWQQKTFREKGLEWSTHCQVFVTSKGNAMRPDTLTYWFGKFIKKTDLPRISLHSLRHTNATLQIANGVAVTTVAGNLGHSNANTTTKIYAHAIQRACAESAEIIDNLLNPIKKEITDK